MRHGLVRGAALALVALAVMAGAALAQSIVGEGQTLGRNPAATNITGVMNPSDSTWYVPRGASGVQYVQQYPALGATYLETPVLSVTSLITVGVAESTAVIPLDGHALTGLVIQSTLGGHYIVQLRWHLGGVDDSSHTVPVLVPNKIDSLATNTAGAPSEFWIDANHQGTNGAGGAPLGRAMADLAGIYTGGFQRLSHVSARIRLAAVDAGGATGANNVTLYFIACKER